VAALAIAIAIAIAIARRTAPAVRFFMISD